MPRAKKAIAEVKEEIKAVEEKVEEKVKAPRARKTAKKGLTLTIQSVMGGSITAEEIAAKIPASATNAYVKVEENKIYWVADNDAGSVDIW